MPWLGTVIRSYRASRGRELSGVGQRQPRQAGTWGGAKPLGDGSDDFWDRADGVLAKPPQPHPVWARHPRGAVAEVPRKISEGPARRWRQARALRWVPGLTLS